MQDCLFCKIIAGEIPTDKVYEDEHFIAFLDIKPINLGHTLLVSKTHHRNLLDMPRELLELVGPITQKLARAITGATNAEGINIGWNNEKAASQIIFHSHIHIMPRFEGDGHIHWSGKEGISESDFREIAQKITEQLTS